MKKQFNVTSLDWPAEKLAEIQAQDTRNPRLAIGLVFVAGFCFYVLFIVLFSIALGLRSQLHLLPDIAITGAVLDLLACGAVLLRLTVSGFHTQVYVLETERIEHHFVQTRNKSVPTEDLLYFLQRVNVTGRSGINSMRQAEFPSGRKCNDNYYAEMVEALEEAGIWRKSKGKRKAGGLRVDYKEALQILNVE